MKRFHLSKLICLLATLLSLVLMTAQVASAAHLQDASSNTMYSITDLGTLGGSFSFSGDINNRGEVTGASAFVGDTALRGFIWKNGVMTDLGTLGGPQAAAGPINSSGQVAGWADLNLPVGPSIFNQTSIFCNPPMVSGQPIVACHAFLRQKGTLTDLGTLGGQNSAAENRGLNSQGQVVGAAETTTVDPTAASGSREFHAFLWRHGKMIDLGTLGGAPDSFGFAINDRGQVVGENITNVQPFIANGTAQGFIWQDGKMTLLGTLGGTSSFPNAINNRGQVVGVASLPGDVAGHAFLWQHGRITDLGTLPGDVFSEAFDITDQGQILGVSCSSSLCRATMWDEGVVTDLNTLISAASGWQLLDAQAENSRGQIVGNGLHNGLSHAYLLTPADAKSGSAATRSMSGKEAQAEAAWAALPVNVRAFLSRNRLGRTWG